MSIMLIVPATVSAQKSTVLIGDKTTAEVKKSVKIISGQLDALKVQIKDLEKDGKKRIADLEREKRILLRNPGKNQFLIIKADAQVKKSEARTDSLLSVCLQKKSELEDQLISFAVTAAGKDQQNIVNLKSRNVNDIADAYLVVKYADKMNSVSSGGTFSADSARIENNWYNPVYVTVKGPAGFHTSFTLGSKKHVVLPISIPGGYTVFYTYGNTTKCINKVFDVRNTDFDSKTGRRYAFLSELPAR